MKIFSATNPEIPIVDHTKPDGSSWTIKEKLWLGLSAQDYRKQFFRNPTDRTTVKIGEQT